jgi:AAA+ ATPase superfamily predicted ATPase
MHSHPPFFDRGAELRALEERWSSDRAEALIVVGRRRVGKSRLLERFFSDKACIHLVGAHSTSRVQLVDATREVARVTGDPALEHQRFESWDALLAYVGAYARERRVGFVLDEFACYCDAERALPSLLQRWWDRVGQRTRVMMVLASSHVAFMEREVLGGPALYGRRTGVLRVRPFDFYDAARFFPEYPAVDRIRAYAVFGGMPAYLAACRASQSLRRNIRQVILEDDAYLRHEPAFLLSQERSIDRPAAYLSVLRAIAAGETQPSTIAQAAGFRSATDITRILERLRELGLVERRVPVTDEGARTRNALYLLTDHFLAFWFRFVGPSAAALEQGQAEWVLAHRIAPELDRFASRPNGPWEEACRAYLWRARRAGRIEVAFDRLGPWWQGRAADGAVEVDLLGLDGDRVVLAASCKWRNEHAKVGDLNDLVAAAARAGATAETKYALFARGGFEPNLVELARARDVLLVSPDGMFDPALGERR